VKCSVKRRYGDKRKACMAKKKAREGAEGKGMVCRYHEVCEGMSGSAATTVINDRAAQNVMV